jgi:phage-related minor tail protein
MPDISRLSIEIDSSGVLKAEGNLEVFAKMGLKASRQATDLADKFGAFQLIANKLPGPLKSVASGMLGIVDPATAAISAVLELGEAITNFVKQGYSAYTEQEAQLARLDAVLRSTGASAWTTSTQLKNMAISLESSTGRTMEEILQMQSVLAGFTSITGERFERLTEDMIDMASVMGGGLVASANAFGKALDTPLESISALTRYGFKFTVEQKNMIKALEDTGRHAEAQAVILESMENAFDGSAEAAKKSKEAVADYGIAFTNLKKAIGEAYKPSIDAGVGLIAKQIQLVANLMQSVNDLGKARSYLAKEDKNDNSNDAIIKRLEAQKTIAEYMTTIAVTSKNKNNEYLYPKIPDKL